jgi:hypothetical protein
MECSSPPVNPIDRFVLLVCFNKPKLLNLPNPSLHLRRGRDSLPAFRLGWGPLKL